MASISVNSLFLNWLSCSNLVAIEGLILGHQMLHRTAMAAKSVQMTTHLIKYKKASSSSSLNILDLLWQQSSILLTLGENIERKNMCNGGKFLRLRSNETYDFSTNIYLVM